MKKRRIDTKPFTIQLTKEERLALELKAHIADLSLSEFVRQSIKKVKISNLDDRELKKERTRQIARIGNNLNQIARKVNSNENTINTAKIRSDLKAIKQKLVSLERIEEVD